MIMSGESLAKRRTISFRVTSDLLDAFLVVVELEGIAARRAAQRILDDVLNDAQQENALCQKSVLPLDIVEFNLANMPFHNVIIRGSKNRLFQDQLSTTRPVIFPFRYHVSTFSGYMGKSMEEHSALLTALSTGDADRA